MDSNPSVMRTVVAADARAAELKGDTDVIPKGVYCYRPLGEGHVNAVGLFVYPVEPCPYWASNPDKDSQENGYCAFMKIGDWMEDGTWHLWDQVKECGLNDDMEPDDVEEAAAA